MEFKFRESILQDYLKILSSDIDRFLNWFEKASPFGSGMISSTSEITFGINGNYEIDSYCEPFNDDIDKVLITTSQSMWNAVDDLMYRMMCNADFLSAEFLTGERLYTPIDITLFKYMDLSPYSRYNNYKPFRNPFQNLVKKYTNKLESLSLFFYGIPNSPERKKLGQFMAHISMTWIYTHEHIHHYAGHLRYLEDYGSNAIISETKLKGNEALKELKKGFEWEADMQATLGIILMYFKEDYYKYLPGYCEQDKRIWLLRIIIMSVVGVCMIFQKQYEIEDIEQSYPKNITRILSILYYSIHISSEPYMPHLKTSSKDVDNIVGNVLNDSFQMSDLLYTHSDQVGIDDYNFDKDFKSLNIFKDMSDLEYIHTHFPLLLNNKEKLKKISPPRLFDKFFKEFIELGDYYDNTLIHQLEKYRKLTTVGESIYGEK